MKGTAHPFYFHFNLSFILGNDSTQHFESVQVIRLFSAQEPVTGLPPTTFRLQTPKHRQSRPRTLQSDHCHLFFSYGKRLKQLL